MSEQNYKDFWDEALKEIHQDYINKGQETEFLIWFNMEYLEDTLTEIKVGVASDFMWSRMVSMGYVSAIQSKIAQFTGRNINISYVVKNNVKSPYTASESQNSVETGNSVNTPEPQSQQQAPSIQQNNIIQENTASSAPEVPVFKQHPKLNENCTFEKFVTGENSDFAYNVSLAVAKNPGKAYNPLLIYGGVGLGKTHLMQSIGNYIYAQKGDTSKICYITAENYTNEFIQATQEGPQSINRFKNKYRKLDLLLLDDIHFFKDKIGTQEEVFYTFEALEGIKAQMVFTCDRPVSELNGFSERLKSRFSKGMCLDLQPPNYETRCAIIQKKLANMNKTIPQVDVDVVSYIAENVQTNVRDLEACLTKVLGFTELTHKSITPSILQNLLRDQVSQISNENITIDIVQKVVADYYNISISDIKGKKRNSHVVVPRQIAIYIARQLGGFSYPQLGDDFGGRDHTTIMHSFNLVEDKIKIDSNFNSLIETLIKQVKEYKK
ncbi:chromosomal replication initiator protein DnaA [Treponema sp.]|uniref:chromosomal replication initiator protein DnaA n=1 Tax=Treponema sp. TaxID=166 RepID=UPI0025D40B27|nr:chromosomal replication initiator protein DnaA [Treponema sp.]MCR5219245.1 chromosomal replication initiator protein DnaA [Treponema sp.]